MSAPQKKNGRFCCEGMLKWTLDTGGLHESAHVIEGVRHLSKEESSVVLQQIINEHIKALQNYHGVFHP